MRPQANVPPPWLWLNVLSLDAPIVALVWQDFVSRCYPSLLRMPGRWVLGLTVWAIYIADRLLDVRQPATANETARHHFYRKHGLFARILLGGVLSVDAWLALTQLRPAVFLNGMMIGGAVAVYLLLFSWGRSRGYGKQVTGSLLFTSGVFLVAWTGTGRTAPVLMEPALAFCALCFGNLVLVEGWERGQSLSSAGVWLLALSLVCWLIGDSNYYKAISFSGAVLALLALCGSRVEAGQLLSVLADSALLTPLLFR